MLTFIVWLAVILAGYYLVVRIFFMDEVKAAMDRDPAAKNHVEVIFTYSGVHALVFHRIAHDLNKTGIPFLPRLISQVTKWVTGIEIHPGAEIGKSLFIDHGMGVVIGETTIIGENVTLFQGVTLGGTGKETGKRHPTLGNNVVIGTGAKVLGDIRVGDNVNIGANAVVIREVPDDSTVVGVPGRVTKKRGKRLPGGVNLDHSSLPDPLQQALEKLQHEIDHIEHEIGEYHNKGPHKNESK